MEMLKHAQQETLASLTERVRHIPYTDTLRSWIARLVIAPSIWQERQQLAALDDDALADLGISRHAAEQEYCRRFLDIPADRL